MVFEDQPDLDGQLVGITIDERLNTRSSQGPGMRVLATSEGTWVYDPEKGFSIVADECNPNSGVASVVGSSSVVVWGGQNCRSGATLQSGKGYIYAAE